MSMPDIDKNLHVIRELLTFIGEDPDREGLIETPKRVLKAWKEMCSGYKTDVPALFKTFEDGAENYNEMIIVDNIPFTSACEHHMLQFTGTVDIAYIPDGRIIGLSKFARITEAFARRLQVQERMTSQIANVIDDNLKPKGCAVVIRAGHSCMSCRGSKTHGTITTTSAMRGVFLDSTNNARMEFLSLTNRR